MPLLHLVEVQSELFPQGLPVAHAGAHAGAWHKPPVQILEPQSAAVPHAFPSLQVGAHPGDAHFPF